MVVYALAQIISAPAQIISAPAQPPATGAVVYTALFSSSSYSQPIAMVNGDSSFSLSSIFLHRVPSLLSLSLRFVTCSDTQTIVYYIFLFVLRTSTSTIVYHFIVFRTSIMLTYSFTSHSCGFEYRNNAEKRSFPCSDVNIASDLPFISTQGYHKKKIFHHCLSPGE